MQNCRIWSSTCKALISTLMSWTHGLSFGGTQQYSSRKFYALAFKHLQGPPTFKRVWNSKCTQRICFYMWLILVDRLNTKTMLRRRKCNVQPNVFCVMCVMGMWRRISITYFSPAHLQLAASKSWASIGSLGQISLRLSRTPYPTCGCPSSLRFSSLLLGDYGAWGTERFLMLREPPSI